MQEYRLVDSSTTMDRAYYYDKEKFPNPRDFDRRNPELYADAVFKAIQEKFSYERGGEMDSVFKREARTFARTYAHAELDEHLILKPGVLRYATRAQEENVSESSVETNTKRLRDRFQNKDWLLADTDWVLKSEELSQCEFVLVRNIQNEINANVLGNVAEDLVIPRDYFEDLAEHAIGEFREKQTSEEKKVPTSEVEAFVAAFETKLKRYGLTPLTAEESPARIWVRPEELYEVINPHEKDGRLPASELVNQIRREIINRLGDIEATYVLTPLLEEFEVFLRERGWNKIRLPEPEATGDRSEEHIWYDNNRDISKALEDLIGKYGEYFDTSRYRYKDLAEENNIRTHTFQFFSNNKTQLISQGFYELRELEDALDRHKYRMDATEVFLEWLEAENRIGEPVLEPTDIS